MLMKKVSLILLCLFNISLYSQLLQDDFEGSSSINWQQDDCEVIEAFENPYLEGINTSNNVLSYHDTGGSFANAFFNYSASINLGTNTVFSFKIYVPSSGVTGNQPNQVSLKLQNNQIPAPWSTQTEIIKPIILDEWQEVSFDFANDNYINLSPDSPAPLNRNDLNKVLIQINGENNTDEVLAYIDDFYFQGEESDEEPVEDPIYDELVWADEFDGNGAIDLTKWHHQTVLPLNGNSWFNGEIQHYTNRTDNSYLDNGELHIVAKNETFTDQGITKDYTSARLNSKFAFTYGRVEVKAKLPTGVGTWPAIWMLGTNIEEIGTYWDNEGFGTTPWPACGEIDIMEHWGTNQNYISSAMHTPSSFGGTINHGGQVIPTASTDYHVYTLEWFPNRMVFSVDDVVHYTYQPNVYNADTWPFDKDQFILLNIAIEPSIDPTFTESSMDIDYVRIYQETNLSSNDFTVENKLKIAPNPAINQTHIYAPAEAMGTQLSIFDTQGRLIDKVSIHTTRVQINTSEWSPGIYLIKETNTKQSHTYKLIKQ
mgnify:CR=1 FL=1